MSNEILSIGSFTIYGYGLMTGIGVLAAYFSAEYRAKRKNLNPDLILGLVIWCLVGGYLGSKILFYITVIDEIIADPSYILRTIKNGWVIYGGLIGGTISATLYARVYKKMRCLPLLDIALPSVALAQAFGRIGCFWAGCCYGRPTDSWFGIAYTQPGYPMVGTPLIPSQLISSALDFLNFLVLTWIARRKKAEGQVIGWYLIFYSVGRFMVEFLRGDAERGSVGQLSTSQFIAVFTLIAGIALTAGTGYLAKKGVRALMTGENGAALDGGALIPRTAFDSVEKTPEDEKSSDTAEELSEETEKNV